MNKHNVIFRRPTSEIAMEILEILIIGGAVAIAATSPLFIQNLSKGFKKFKKYSNKKVYDTFYRLRQQGFINFYEKNNQIYISLTEKGKKKAGWMQIDNLKLKKPEKWDRKWRILLFDIAEMKRLHREALRGKLMNMGFVMLQKSAWVIPYKCDKEVELLKSFFGLSNKEVRLLTVDDIGDDSEYKKYFHIN